MVMNINKSNFSILILLLVLTVLSGCETVAKFDEVAQGSSNNSVSSISFNGIDSITNVTDSTLNISWTHTTGAISYQVFSVNGSSLTSIGLVVAPTASFTLTGLSPSTALKFKVKAYDSNGDGDSNNNIVSVTTNLVPDLPLGFTLTAPTISPGINPTPTITVNGVKSGDNIKLFSDISCSTEVGSAVSSGATVAITTSTLALASYTFYASATGAGGESSCSTANISYTMGCPAGFISVPSMAAVNVPNDFCVMKYEAKDDGSGNAVSTDTGAPWVNINQLNAKAECQSLGANYDLISNPEWMAIARNVENVPSNWTNNGVGDGCLKRGNVGGAYTCTGGDSGYFSGTSESGTGRNALASLVLDNGEIIWDLSGNVWEWTDWTLGGALSTNMTQAQKASQGGTPVTSSIEYTVIDTFTAHSPAIALLPDNPSFDADEGMGRYSAGSNGGAARRGGVWNNGTDAGAFALGLSFSSLADFSSIGFRCVFRPY